MPDTRARIRRHVRETPGVHFNRVGRDLESPPDRRSTTSVGSSATARSRSSGSADAPTTSTRPSTRGSGGPSPSSGETAREILVRLHADGPTRSTTLADELDLARSTVSWHVSNLVESGIVEKSDERPMHLSLAFPERTATLFDEVSPSLPDRIVDRFVRTVDSLFE